jgi:uncharacterized protein (TIGR02145 family)
MKMRFTFHLAILVMVIGLQAQVPTDGLVVNYTFDNTLSDAASGYNLTSSGSTYAAGVINNAFQFTGTEECSTTDLTFRRVFDNTNSWSVNLWFNSSIAYDTPTGFGDPSKALLTCDGVNTTPYKRTWILVDQRGILFSRMLGSGNGGSIHTYYPFEPDTWYHVSVNFYGTGADVYINGVLTAPSYEAGDIGQDIGSVDANTTAVTIGGNQQNNVAQWKGSIDQVRVYNRTLTPNEVKTVYEESGRSILDEGLVAYYPFNGNAIDESGNGNDGTVYGATLANDRFSINSKSYAFDGDDFIDFGTNPQFEFFGSQQEVTFSLWFKIDDLSLPQTFIAKGRWSADPLTGNKYFAIEYQPEHNRIIQTLYNYSTLNDVYVENIDSKIIAGQWYHLVYTRSSNSKLYLNGEDATTYVQNAGWSTDYNLVLSNTQTVFGYRINDAPENFMDGAMDDIRAYNRALTESEIQSLYHENGYATVSDIDGNTYKTVQIGNQIWMAENLKTTAYANGDIIGTTSPDNLDISSETEPKYQWAYQYDENLVNDYGRLYTWYAINDDRGVCPAGWHVPSDEEWKELEMFLGMTQEQADAIGWRGTDQGTQLKSETGWVAGGADIGTNTVGFNAIPASLRPADGAFGSIGTIANWWTSNEYSGPEDFGIPNYNGAYYRYLNNNSAESNGIVRWYNNQKNAGLSIRCLKNSSKSISVISETVDEGQQAIIPITVSDLTTKDNIISYQFDIAFDNTSLEYTGADLTGTIAVGGTVEVNTSVTGKLSVSYMTSTALVGAGEILNLQFNTLKADTTKVLISNAYLNSTPITDLTNGTVIIKDVTPPTAAFTYDDTENRCGDDLLITATFSEPMSGVSPVKISMTGGANVTAEDMTRVNETAYTFIFKVPVSSGDVTVYLSNGTDLWGNEVVSTPTSGANFSIIPITYGDVDDDGKILAYDAALTLQYSIGLDPLPVIDPLPWENWRDTTANVDGVGAVTANDAGMILQYSAGIITSFDASAKKSLMVADVNIELIDGEVVFHSSGYLIGLNVSTVNENNILGEPVIVAENFLSAKNIFGTTYKIGLCTSTPAFEGDELIRIPFNANGQVTFDMVVNTVVKSVTVDLATGVIGVDFEGISIYPNPVSDMLHIEGLQKETIGSIYNANGQMIFSSEVGAGYGKIDVSALPSGLYLLKMTIDEELLVKRFTKE